MSQFATTFPDPVGPTIRALTSEDPTLSTKAKRCWESSSTKTVSFWLLRCVPFRQWISTLSRVLLWSNYLFDAALDCVNSQVEIRLIKSKTSVTE